MTRVDTEQMHEIITQLKHNNMEVFDDFYELTKRQVYMSILSIVKNKTICDDLMQDTYLKFLANIHRYKEKTNVIAFIVTIARNIAINSYNKQKNEMFYDFSAYEDTYCDQSKNVTPLLDIVYET